MSSLLISNDIQKIHGKSIVKNEKNEIFNKNILFVNVNSYIFVINDSMC